MAQASFVYLQKKKQVHYGASLVINDEKKSGKSGHLYLFKETWS